MSRTHNLKTDPDCFAASVVGVKPFEIRLNDRDYQVGDVLELAETVHSSHAMQAGRPLRYTGRYFTVKVTYILSGYGLAEHWVVMGVKAI